MTKSDWCPDSAGGSSSSLESWHIGRARLRPLAVLSVVFLLCTSATVRPVPASSQISPADSAAVLLETARLFEASDQWDVAEAVYRFIVEHFARTDAAVDARERLASPPRDVVYGSGRVELQVWTTLYGSWLGLAVPGALGADSSEPYGVGLLVGGPTGFLAGGTIARSLNLSAGQARAITLGGSWGTWQGYGWQEVFELGISEVCETDPGGTREFCYRDEDSSEETFAAMILGGLTGIAAGALISNRDITPGTATAANFGSLWGTWFGVAGGVLLDLEDDNLLAAALIGGNAGLAVTALLAPRWQVSRSRARMVSIAGVLGGLGGVGIDLLAQPDDEKVAIAIPLATSILGLVLGSRATRDDDDAPGLGVFEAASNGALVGLHDGRLSLGAPVPVPTLMPWNGASTHRSRLAVRLELFRAQF